MSKSKRFNQILADIFKIPAKQRCPQCSGFNICEFKREQTLEKYHIRFFDTIWFQCLDCKTTFLGD